MEKALKAVTSDICMSVRHAAAQFDVRTEIHTT